MTDGVKTMVKSVKKGENNLLSKRFGLCMKQETNFCISIRNAEIETVRKYIEEQG
jgi:hypothetical protein